MEWLIIHMAVNEGHSRAVHMGGQQGLCSLQTSIIFVLTAASAIGNHLRAEHLAQFILEERTSRSCTKLRRHLTIWKVVEESSPVLISSMNSVFVGPTISSPVGGKNQARLSGAAHSASTRQRFMCMPRSKPVHVSTAAV